MKTFFNKVITLAASILITSIVYGQSTWLVDNAHTTVKFTVVHMKISEVDGNFKLYSGTIISSKPDFSDAQIDFSVNVASVNTDNDMRDNHLRSNEFFDAEKYPKMTFKSISFKKRPDGKYDLVGNLTIRDVTKSVTFLVSYGGTALDQYGNTMAGFKSSTTINRQDFNLKWTGRTKAGELIVSDDIQIELKLEFSLQK